ncbi:TPA: hypothetical protein QB401_001263 [Pasteurella multocida]|uniref:hypothetical protein n=1 Tax=Pasteurella multocida TaxID=747 RepID=UPI0028791299|nr:hypothetical protein [Pasteurella multocida]MEB3491601.1 hypothetical protein [Pasteurella multocida]HDR1108773.1 hypothetical protein [Pasteurella multocida]HDR1129099.1 hypothetical protein [Pasteurella multocida]HDR1137472.1 hypothetical protein [Pasteurella multocida]HDR1188145.1 hypothetical protein [Pasteurella multocida]
MKQEDREYLQSIIENEGFDYAFVGYSHFKEIQDEEFHKLRLAYLAAQKALEDYINN